MTKFPSRSGSRRIGADRTTGARWNCSEARTGTSPDTFMHGYIYGIPAEKPPVGEIKRFHARHIDYYRSGWTMKGSQDAACRKLPQDRYQQQQSRKTCIHSPAVDDSSFMFCICTWLFFSSPLAPINISLTRPMRPTWSLCFPRKYSGFNLRFKLGCMA